MLALDRGTWRSAAAMVAGLLWGLVAAGSAQAADAPWAGYTVLDLTHTFDTDTVYWPTEAGFELSVGFEGINDKGYFYKSNHFAAADHGGTHLDAPVHFAQGRLAADAVPLTSLMGPACVIDVSNKAASDPDYSLTVDDIDAWEQVHGLIPAGCIVVMNTGYHRFWPDRQAYMGTALAGAQGVANLHFPGFSAAAAELLVKRKIAAVGIDTPSIDPGQSEDFLVHRYLYARDIPGMENLAGTGALPPTGAWLIALPMKIGQASGAPLRVIAMVPATNN